MAREYRVVSADSHLDLNPEVWAHRVPAKYRDRGPKRITMPNGADAVQAENGRVNTIGITRNVGVPFDQMPLIVSKFSEPVGNGTAEQRVAEQDQDGVDAEIMFTWIDQLLRATDDDDLYRVLVRSYNEYIAEEYRAVAPDRLFPQGVIPTTNIDDAVGELENCAKLGYKGVTLSCFPSGHSYPSPEDDRFWAASLDLRMALAQHGGGRIGGFGGSGSRKPEPTFLYPKENDSPDNHKTDAIGLLFSNASSTPYGAMQIAYAGVFDRFPDLKIYFAETMAGWIPFLLFMVDDNYRRYQPMMRHFWGLADLERMPSEYMKEHTYWGTLFDPVGIQGRDAIGAGHIMFCTDFPHAAGDWPNTQWVIDQVFEGVPDDDKHMLLAGNAVKYWHLDES